MNKKEIEDKLLFFEQYTEYLDRRITDNTDINKQIIQTLDKLVDIIKVIS